jgi:hypothetical protein
LSALTKTVAEKETKALLSNIKPVYDVPKFQLSFSFLHTCLASISIWFQITPTKVLYPQKKINNTKWKELRITQSTKVSVPSAELGPPHPLSRKRVCPPPAGEVVGGYQFGRLGEKS